MRRCDSSIEAFSIRCPDSESFSGRTRFPSSKGLPPHRIRRSTRFSTGGWVLNRLMRRRRQRAHDEHVRRRGGRLPSAPAGIRPRSFEGPRQRLGFPQKRAPVSSARYRGSGRRHLDQHRPEGREDRHHEELQPPPPPSRRPSAAEDRASAHVGQHHDRPARVAATVPIRMSRFRTCAISWPARLPVVPGRATAGSPPSPPPPRGPGRVRSRRRWATPGDDVDLRHRHSRRNGDPADHPWSCGDRLPSPPGVVHPQDDLVENQYDPTFMTIASPKAKIIPIAPDRVSHEHEQDR